jgi:hypothetical protein
MSVIDINVTYGVMFSKRITYVMGIRVKWWLAFLIPSESDTLDYESDQDWIITTQPEFDPYTREHNCQHEKLAGGYTAMYTPSQNELVCEGIVPDAIGRIGEAASAVFYLSDGTRETMTIDSVVAEKQADGSYHFTGKFTATHYDSDGWYTTIVRNLSEFCEMRRLSKVDDSPTARAEMKKSVVQTLRSEGLVDFTSSKRHREMIYRKAHELCHPGELAASAAASARRLDINTLAYIKDIVEIPAFGSGLVSLGNEFAEYITQHPFKSITKSTDNVKRFAKHLGKVSSKAYLSGHYGLKLTVQDTRDISRAIEATDFTQPDQTLGGSSSVTVDLPAYGYSVAVNMKLTAVVGSYDDKQLKTCESVRDSMTQLKNMVLRSGYELDALPTAANLWDLVPFSFVVDWFLPIGDYFAQREMGNYMATLPLKRCFLTHTLDWEEPVNHGFDLLSPDGTLIAMKASGVISHHVYDREVLPTLPQPPMGKNNTGKGNAVDHVVEAGALLVSSVH